MKASELRKSDIDKLPFIGGFDNEQMNRRWSNILIVPTRKKHDSGFAHIALVGADRQGEEVVGVLAYPDDVELPFAPYSYGEFTDNDIRLDAYYPSGILRLWSRRSEFIVNGPISSVRITAVPRDGA